MRKMRHDSSVYPQIFYSHAATKKGCYFISAFFSDLCISSYVAEFYYFFVWFNFIRQTRHAWHRVCQPCQAHKKSVSEKFACLPV